jgi:beta-lactamase class A
MTPEAVLEKLFTSKEPEEEWFTSEFLAQVPIAQIQLILAGIKSQLGTYQKVESKEQDYVIIFSRGSVPTSISLNDQGQISGLLFKSVIVNVENLEAAVASLKALPGKVSFIVKEGETVLAALNTTTPLAVGSAFKLAILKALKSQIATGQRSWEDVVQLQPTWKSLPSGMLQNWPDKSFLTVQTLATLMISVSDNTATDSLINIVGREAIETVSPRNRPFLTTREAFILKGSSNRNLLERYRHSNEQRRTILTETEKLPLPNVNEFTSKPVALDVEWFFTVEELCDLMTDVADLPLMSINPGIANPQDWERVVFKGGSEPGVMNLTTWLKAKNGKQYCIAATWNNSNAPVDESQFAGLYGGAIANLVNRL